MPAAVVLVIVVKHLRANEWLRRQRCAGTPRRVSPLHLGVGVGGDVDGDLDRVALLVGLDEVDHAAGRRSDATGRASRLDLGLEADFGGGLLGDLVSGHDPHITHNS
jgi:hypothetical protein